MRAADVHDPAEAEAESAPIEARAVPDIAHRAARPRPLVPQVAGGKSLPGARTRCDARIMNSSPDSEGTQPAGRHAKPSGTASSTVAWRPLEPLPTTQSACCCSARPVVRVMMPPAAPARDPADLLLCGHHYRVSRESLKAAGAVAFDASGTLIMPLAWETEPKLLATHQAG